MRERDSQVFNSYGEYISSTYPAYLKRLGLNATAVKALGATITDSQGKTYIDCIGGYGLYNLGHNPPEVISALIDQLNSRQLFNKPFITEPQTELAEILAGITPGDLKCSFLCNSGSEAIDSAIKLARLSTKKPNIIAAQGGFHGFTMGALAATGIPSFRHPLGPFVPNITHVPFGDIDALSETITDETAAVLLEVIQHEAGVRLASKSYFQHVRQICNRRGALLVIDEIKTGFGKTGKMFACEHYEIKPDILVLGKSMGGGLIPIGAVIGKEHLWKKFSYSFPMSASSFAGNILAVTAALKTIEILRSNTLIKDCIVKGDRLKQGLHEIQDKYSDKIREVKGLGLLIGIQTASKQTALDISQKAAKEGVLIFSTYGDSSVLMIEPPLVITEQQIKQVLDTLQSACQTENQN